MIPGCENTKISIYAAKQPLSAKGGKQRTPLQGAKGGAAEPDMKLRLARRNTNDGIRKIYSCGLCGKDTRIDLPPPVPLPKQRRRAALASRVGDRKTVAVSAAKADIVLSTTKPPQKTSKIMEPAVALVAPSTTVGANAASNANSKKRAKSRKAGLLALLNKSRESASGGGLDNLSLSFDDFRKK
ncbi:hypothetical protein CMQ_7987 [Grosmannia clavigera kw1407]|uniref:Uncharacterized protein n=1 Tax=Grosmannia clavigera (strain kw1407 / UAMH 11150) TaxID=655863 RepID=F0XRS2_GROCL|nr:uncharacterized protein CMQ_7987 [Grosmannia clavigera kw1407]EFW99619.1 hypothetical protein CMQ_7987 [Grosmannia clavigera kw1407]